MEQHTRNILVKARELITDEKHWVQGQLGKDDNGLCVFTDELKNATCFCAMGALIRAHQMLQQDNTIEDAPDEVYEALNVKVLSMGAAIDSATPFVSFNDHYSHKEVLALFDSVISDV